MSPVTCHLSLLMSEAIDKFFRQMPIGRRSRPTERLWCPPADVVETREGWIVKIELAGVSPDEVEITIDDRTLHVAGVRRDALYSESVSYYQMEITYSRFHKKLQFPQAIAGALIEQDYRDGLLVLHLRRAETGEIKRTASA